MADRIIKSDSGNDVVIQNNAGSRKIEVTNSGDVEVTGDFKATTVKATNLKANDGTAGLSIADSTGQVTSSGKIDLNGNELVLDADADSSITADTDDQIDFRAGGTDSVKIGNEHLTINNGNLVIGTAGHGIDFSINSHQSGMTGELLDFYERGNWTPTINPTTGSITTQSNQAGIYQRVGNIVTLNFSFKIEDAGTASGTYIVTGLPFNVIRSGSGVVPAGCGYESVATGQMLQLTANSSTEIRVAKYDHNGLTNDNSFFNGSITYQTS